MARRERYASAERLGELKEAVGAREGAAVAAAARELGAAAVAASAALVAASAAVSASAAAVVAQAAAAVAAAAAAAVSVAAPVFARSWRLRPQAAAGVKPRTAREAAGVPMNILERRNLSRRRQTTRRCTRYIGRPWRCLG